MAAEPMTSAERFEIQCLMAAHAHELSFDGRHITGYDAQGMLHTVDARRVMEAALAAPPAVRVVDADFGYGYCPVQIEGRTHDDRAYYFRARGGGWALHIATTAEEADAVCSPVYMQGRIEKMFSAGWMPHSLAKALVDWALSVREAHDDAARPTSGEGSGVKESLTTHEGATVVESATVGATRKDSLHVGDVVAEWLSRGCVLVPVSTDLLGTEWRKTPIFVELIANDDGTYSMQCTEATPPQGEGRAVTDAERMKWLSLHATDVRCHDGPDDGSDAVCWTVTTQSACGSGVTLREAIDAALARTEGDHA